MSNRSGHPLEGAGVETIAAARTLDRKESGLLVVAGAVDLVATLPPASAPGMAGVFFDFYVGTLSTTTGFSISPQAADLIIAPGVTAAVDKDLINTAASDALGDSVRLTCNGTTGWVATAMRGTWARQA